MTTFGRIVKVFAPLLGAAMASVFPAPSFAASQNPCTAPEFRQWDFWLGAWRVTDPKGVFQGTNDITPAPGGCGLIENWTNAEGGRGSSFNGYDAALRKWTQLWISPGVVIRLEGNLDSQGAMRMEGTISYNARRIVHPFRGLWTPLPDGSVRQEFHEYDPKTRAWSEWFTGIYRHPDPPPATAATCTAPESRQFDFWVGKWDVFDRKSGERAGSSLIEKLYGGCVLRENWTEPGFAGGSLNVYAASDGKWHQTWVDQTGALREFVGAMVDGTMTLVAKVQTPAAPDGMLVRMKFDANPDGTVRQHSEYSKDGGQTWLERYDYLYRPAVTP
jgi:hypothetical protein